MIGCLECPDTGVEHLAHLLILHLVEILERENGPLLVGKLGNGVLKAKLGSIIMTLHTLDAMGKSTDVRFYDPRWTPQPETVVTLKVPPFESFWCPPIGLDANQMNVYANLLREAPISAKWDPSHQTLEFSISTSDLDAGIREQAAKCIYPVKLRFERKEAGWGFVE